MFSYDWPDTSFPFARLLESHLLCSSFGWDLIQMAGLNKFLRQLFKIYLMSGAIPS